MRTLVAYSLLFALLLPKLSMANPCQNEHCAVGIRKALDIAQAATADGNERASKFELTAAKRYSNPWNDVVPVHPEGSYERDLYSKLQNRTYWMVYFAPADNALGGDVTIFIDASTGEIIAIHRGK
jgi:hypothetical protein